MVTGDSSGNLIVWIEDKERGVRLASSGSLHVTTEANGALQFVRATGLTVPGSISSMASIETNQGQFLIAAGSSHPELHIFQYVLNGKSGLI